MSVMSPEKCKELVFLYKNRSGQVRCNQPKNTIWVIFCKKQRWVLCFCLLCRFRFGRISKTCITWGSWRYCAVSVFYICTWENGRPLQITFYYLRICQTNCLICATRDPLKMEGASLISLIWPKLKSILGFDVSAILVVTQMKVHFFLVCFGWFWCCSVLFFVDFGQNPRALFMHFLCAFEKRIKSAYTFLKSVYTFCALFNGA